ncbi:Uncharacterised protein [Candidatus Burarchaeum australiense]|nr:Uncharacterised protein [Candidatus Burarchaeum australiense]
MGYIIVYNPAPAQNRPLKWVRMMQVSSTSGSNLQQLQRTVAFLKRQFVDAVPFERASDVFISLALGRAPERPTEPALSKLVQSGSVNGVPHPITEAIRVIAFDLASQKMRASLLSAKSDDPLLETMLNEPAFKDLLACAQLLTPEILDALPNNYRKTVSRFLQMNAMTLHKLGKYADSWTFYNKMLEVEPGYADGRGSFAAFMAEQALNNRPENPGAEYASYLKNLYDELTFCIRASGTDSIPAHQARAAVSFALAGSEPEPAKKKELLAEAVSDIGFALRHLNEKELTENEIAPIFSCYLNLAAVHLELGKLAESGSSMQRYHLENADDYNKLANAFLPKIRDAPPKYAEAVAECREEIDAALSKLNAGV